MTETTEQRSRTMRAVRSHDTGPEMVVRRFLHSLGFRYRLHSRELPGVPDIVFPSRRIAIFVHGCFWHQHPGCHKAARPKSNIEYWTRKLDGNMARDERHYVALKNAGWKVLIIWECETRDRGALEELASRIHSGSE
ncbi:very short patch repair endonuclease [Pseudomonas sp.]|uniref:very short patch repair endonuclease n=1 Tax=Pseudomonas sp. TaxID=306 RepID=UPI0028A66323|nr:very short patch repair endonuclease [Pseudomonas sp.]